MTETKTHEQEQQEQEQAHLAAMKAAIVSFNDCCEKLRTELGFTEPRWDGTDQIEQTAIVTKRGTFLLVKHRWRDRGCSWGCSTYIEGPIRTEKDRLDIDYAPQRLYLRGLGGLNEEESESLGFEVLLMDVIRNLECDLRAALDKRLPSIAVRRAGNWLLRFLGISS